MLSADRSALACAQATIAQLPLEPLGAEVLGTFIKLLTSVLSSCLGCHQAWLLRLLQEALQQPQTSSGNVQFLVYMSIGR